MIGSNFVRVVENGNNSDEIDWELRPGGMLVQKSDGDDDGSSASGPMITVKVSHGSYQYDVSVPAQSTFGDLKRTIAHETGMEPKDQRLLFRGKEKEDDEYLHMAGVKDSAKIILMEDPASKENKLEETERKDEISRACESIAKVRADVDKLSQKVAELEAAVQSGKKVAEKDFLVLTELLMVQLLKLDGIEAGGEAKVQRRLEVRRIQNYVETLDSLKARNSNPFSGSNNGNAVLVTTKWETFDSGSGSLGAPPPPSSSSPPDPMKEWERFD